MAILVTGGAGFIGSHTIVELYKAGYKAVILDNLSNSSPNVVDRLEAIVGEKIPFYEGDIADPEVYKEIFSNNIIDAVIHFAGFKAVGESVANPLKYYQNNVAGSLVLFDEMRKRNMKKIIFSSSATVYGDPEEIPITENCPAGNVTNPYGRTKVFLEEILSDLVKSDPEWSVVVLRYFNPIGAYKSGTIGEDPNGIPDNLMPFITQVAIKRRDKLSVFGGDYDTHDGTCIRDYIHVTDLAKGHVQSLKKIGVVAEGASNELQVENGMLIYNLGTGKGSSVLDVINAFEEATGVGIAYEITERRPGDVAVCYCDASKAEKELKWKADLSLKDMCADAWRWQSNNPEGFKE